METLFRLSSRSSSQSRLASSALGGLTALCPTFRRTSQAAAFAARFSGLSNFISTCRLFSRSQTFFLSLNPLCGFRKEGRNLRKAFGQLVLLGSDLAALAPATYLRRSLRRPSWRSYLGGGFVLRCFQHLSWPDADTRRCTWRHNRQTGGLSNTVLSY